ncbi:glycosyltransferase family 2 protein [Candidatus Saccharibacteria bacterium]|nr:glycosyltransferase family 2 protein [Candidatus Saccharibacteria bacterium]
MINKQPKVAYLVICWNNRDIIDECLHALKEQTYESTDIYVIDNASKDGSADYIEEKYPEIHFVRHNENSGFAKGNNILIKEVLKDKDVEYIALINSDAMLDKHWTSEVVDFLKDKSMVAGAQGITLDYYNHSIVDAEHIYVGTNFHAVQYGYGMRYKKAYAHPRKVFGVNAAAAVYSRSFIEQQHDKKLFDEKFYIYLEDVDVSFRAIMTGWNSYYIPAARAYHMGSVSSKKRSNGFNIEMTFRNNAALLFKNMPLKVFLIHLPEAAKMELQYYRHMYKRFGFVAMLRVVRARLVGILRLPLYISDRRRITKQRKISNTTLDRVMRRKGIFG